jgi:hypothetical protein
MHKIYKYSGLFLAVISFSACAKQVKYDLKTELNNYAKPHGLMIRQLEQVDPQAPLPAIAMQTIKNPEESDITLLMYAVNASNESLCLTSASKAMIPAEEFKPLTINKQDFKKQVEEGVKWTSYTYYTYKDGACFFLEGNAYIQTTLSSYPANKNVSEDQFYTSLLNVYAKAVSAKN